MKPGIRFLVQEDLEELFDLYQQVAQQGDGIIRYPFEINRSYIEQFAQKSWNSGFALVLEIDQEIVGEIHAFMHDIFSSRHMLIGLTVVVHPDYQGRGLGRQLFTQFLELVQRGRPDILRIELYVRSHHTKAVALYQSLGFEQEGFLKDRILTKSGALQSPLMMTWRNPQFRSDAFTIPGKKSRISLCPVQEQDLEKLAAVARQVYFEHFVYLWEDGGEWYREWAFSKQKLAAELQEPGTQWYLCYHNGKPAGFLKTIDQKGWQGKDPHAFKLERIYLLHEAKGAGIGRAMLDYVILEAQNRGRQEIWLEVMDSSHGPIALYEKNQFEKFDEHRLDYPHVKDEYRGMFKMRRKLAPL
jgi:putative acetyltransferase